MMAPPPASHRPTTYSKRGRQDGSTAARMDMAQIDPYDIPDDDETTSRPKATYGRLNRKLPGKRASAGPTTDPYNFPSSEDAAEISRSQDAKAASNRLKPMPRLKRTPSHGALVDRSATKSKSPEFGIKRKMDQLDGQPIKVSLKRYAAEGTGAAAPKSKAKMQSPASGETTGSMMPPTSLEDRQPNKTKTISTAQASHRTSTSDSEPSDPYQSMSPRPRAAADTAAHLPPAQRKTRLIDTLVAQANAGSDFDSDLDDEPTPRNQRFATPGDAEVNDTASISQTPTSQRINRAGYDTWARSAQPLASSKKVKHTYGHVRRIREGHQPSSPFTLGVDLQCESLVPSTPSLSSVEPPLDDYGMDDDDGLSVNFKSVHELKREGANHRFTDVMDEMHLRVGIPTENPSSLRRNALIELAQKLQEPSFAVQFRDSAIRDDLARSIGKERDTISGFAMVAALIVFLSSHSAPNLLQRLVEEGLAKLLARLLQEREDIVNVASQRSTNLSKSTRGTISKLVADLKRMKIWHGRVVDFISPRTLSLRLLQYLQHHLDATLIAQVFDDLEDTMILTMEAEVAGGDWKRINTTLIIYILQNESSHDNSRLNPQRFERHAACCLGFFSRALEKWPDMTDEADTAVLKWAINTTNSEAGAAMFGTPMLLDSLACSIHMTLRQSYDATYGDTVTNNELLEVLPLAMGVMINIMEHNPRARQHLQPGSMRGLGKLYFDLRPSISKANTEMKSKVGIAVGYLAIILGYYTLEEGGRNTITGLNTPNALQTIIEAIAHFIALQRSVDVKVHELEHLANELRQVSRRKKAM